MGWFYFTRGCYSAGFLLFSALVVMCDWLAVHDCVDIYGCLKLIWHVNLATFTSIHIRTDTLQENSSIKHLSPENFIIVKKKIAFLPCAIEEKPYCWPEVKWFKKILRLLSFSLSSPLPLPPPLANVVCMFVPQKDKRSILILLLGLHALFIIMAMEFLWVPYFTNLSYLSLELTI